MNLALNASAISKSIREKKKKMLTSAPEMVGTAPQPDLNAQDVYDLEQQGRIESTLNSPKKSDSRLDQGGYDGVGESPAQKKRMGRLRSYMTSFALSGRK